VGEALWGVAVTELTGEICWVCELKRVYCEGDAVNCGTGIARSDAMAVMGFSGEATLSWMVEEVGRRMGGFSRYIQVESGIRRRGVCMGGRTLARANADATMRQCDNTVLPAVSSRSDIVGLNRSDTTSLSNGDRDSGDNEDHVPDGGWNRQW
jgi:hypothetical protein